MSDLLTSFRRFRYLAWRFVGFWFLIIGSIMTLYVGFAMLTHNPDLSLSGAWWGLVGCAGAAVLGFLIIRFRPFKPK